MRNLKIVLLLLVAGVLVGCAQTVGADGAYGDDRHHAAFDKGDRVECNWKSGGTYYPGRVYAADGRRLSIHYDDGDRENTTASKCRPLNARNHGYDRERDHDDDHRAHSKATGQWYFYVKNETGSRITKLMAAEAGEHWGHFDIGSGIYPGKKVKILWSRSTDDELCEQSLKAKFADGTESESEVFDFCEDLNDPIVFEE